MKYFVLIAAALARSRTRTLLTLLSVVTAFLLFGLLDSVRVVFSGSSGVDGADRLIVASKLSLTQSLPVNLERQIAAVPGVRETGFGMWFGGIYQDQRNFFPSFAVSGNYLDLFPEYSIDPEQRRAFDADRSGAVVGRSLAVQFGWKVGDVIPMQATVFPNSDGTNNWPLTLRAVFDLKRQNTAGNDHVMFLHWDYFNESNAFLRDQISTVTVQLDDPGQANQVAQAIDRLSENSDHETRTQTEQAFMTAFARQFADVGLIVTSIMGAVFFTLLLLTGNTMTQAVRERIPELATLKTLGFTNGAVLWLVLAESALLLVIGGILGMLLASIAIHVLGVANGGVLPASRIPAQTWMAALGLMAVIGVLVGLAPALRAMRLNIVDALAGR